MNLFIAIYEHKHGIKAYLLRGQKMPTRKKVARACKIDPDEYEYITIEKMDRQDWPGKKIINID